MDARVHYHPKANLEATSQLKKRDDIIITQHDKGSALGCLKGGELQSVHWINHQSMTRQFTPISVKKPRTQGTTPKHLTIHYFRRSILHCTKNFARNHWRFSNPEEFKTFTSQWSSINPQDASHVSSTVTTFFTSFIFFLPPNTNNNKTRHYTKAKECVSTTGMYVKQQSSVYWFQNRAWRKRQASSSRN